MNKTELEATIELGKELFNASIEVDKKAIQYFFGSDHVIDDTNLPLQLDEEAYWKYFKNEEIMVLWDEIPDPELTEYQHAVTFGDTYNVKPKDLKVDGKYTLFESYLTDDSDEEIESIEYILLLTKNEIK